jgi:Flp pilus assembly pilin Flp
MPNALRSLIAPGGRDDRLGCRSVPQDAISLGERRRFSDAGLDGSLTSIRLIRLSVRKGMEMISLPYRFRSNEGGTTSTEYAMLIVFVALAIPVGVPALGNDTGYLLISVGRALASMTLPTF